MVLKSGSVGKNRFFICNHFKATMIHSIKKLQELIENSKVFKTYYEL